MGLVSRNDVSSQDGHVDEFLAGVPCARDRFRCAMGAARRAARFRSIGYVLVVVLAVMGGCTGATFRGSVYRGEGFAFRVPEPPSTWKRIEVDGKALSFVDASSGTLVAASGRCKVDGEDVPLRSLVQHLFLQFTERDVVLEEVVPFDGREAMHTVVLAKLDGVPKQFDVWVLKKDGCVYDLYCIADPAEFDDAVGPFRKFAQGFSTVRVDDD